MFSCLWNCRELELPATRFDMRFPSIYKHICAYQGMCVRVWYRYLRRALEITTNENVPQNTIIT